MVDIKYKQKRPPRIDIGHPVKYREGDNHDSQIGLLINESETGVLVAVQKKLEIGSTLHIAMDSTVSWNGDAYIIECQVVRYDFINDPIFKYSLGCKINKK